MHQVSKNRVLVLDDEAGVCRWVARVAAQSGYATATTQDPDELAGFLDSFDPTLILLDLVLGSRDGVEVLRQLAAARCRAPIVLMSGLDERVLNSASRLGQSLDLEIAGAVLKPLSLADLRSLFDARRREVSASAAASELGSVELEPPQWATRDTALETSALVVHYQPQRRLSDGLIAGAEALVRWRHPEAGLLPPASFLPRAERTGFVRALTTAVVGASVAQCRRWSDEGRHVPVAINLSPVLLDDLSLPDAIERIVLDAGVSPADVTLEVTESVAIARRQLAMDVLTRLRLKGFGLALDDFGVGFSSLVELQHMPFTEVKIDKSFVSDAASDASARAIVEAITGLGRRLSLRIVAEGIETAAAWSMVCAAGCDVGQGYLISRPLDVDAFDGFIAREDRPRVRVVRRS